MVPRGAPAAGGPGGPNVTIHVHGGVVGARDLAAFVGQVSREVQRGNDSFDFVGQPGDANTKDVIRAAFASSCRSASSFHFPPSVCL